MVEATAAALQRDWLNANIVALLRARAHAQVAPIPADIADRRCEITGPVDRKMVINALNSGASVYMADFEDSNTPTWCALKHCFLESCVP